MTGSPIASVFNDGYIAEMHDAWRRDPASVDESWRQFFRFAESLAGATGGTSPATAGTPDAALLRKTAGAAALVAAIREYGHLAVQIDPLGSAPPGAPELTPEFHGVTEADLHAVPADALVRGAQGTAAEVVEAMRSQYSGAIAYEFEHLASAAERQWFRETVERGEVTAPLRADEKRALLERLTDVAGVEKFLGIAFPNAKRFSIEGLDVLVPMMDEAIARAAEAGASETVIGMAHRGRLNVLMHVMGKPYAKLFAEFAGHHATNATSGTGDVKYHLGYLAEREVAGKPMRIELVPNPSHLEFVNPVMMGVARARQRNGAERNEGAVLPLVVHGDAAFPGEGVVAETLNMALLRGYRVGGSLHLIANNQVGFTTDPTDSRSTRYSSDAAKGFDVPVMHVNGDDAEACIAAVRLAIAYRARFAKDVLIDIVGFRRHGHNEADQPSFTQPKLYDVIRQHPSPRDTWAARLVRERVISEADAQAMDKAAQARFQAAYDAMKAEREQAASHGGDEGPPAPPAPRIGTAVASEQLIALNERMLTWPDGFKLHPTLQRTLPRRREALSQGGIDWGHAEALAFASLLVEGIGVRVTGQDAQRGTFSHRQAVLHDVATGEVYVPLAHLPQATARFEVWNSPLSETAVMAFEYGFSVAATKDLVLWEAQFGDFANVAQPVIDQYLVADRAKWAQDSGLVLLLPHGYEGQGPEHSSARLERFLQLAAEGNMAVAYPSTPAQYFHVLRRQAHRTPRRPLVLMQPKSLLRLPAAASRLEDLTAGTFRPVIDDAAAADRRDEVKRLVFCTGKLYYDLAAAEDRPADVAVVRVEEIYPWPQQEIAQAVDGYPNVEEVVWAQEEPRNMGAWTFVQPRLRASVGTMLPLRYIGRPDRASPAEGYNDAHQVEQQRIVREVLTSPTPSKRKTPARA